MFPAIRPRLRVQGFWRYLFSAALVALATLVGVPVQSVISPTNLDMIYLLAVILAAVYLGRGPSMVTAALGVLAMDFFFVPPVLTFVVAKAEDLVTLAGLLLVGVVISTLTTRERQEADAAQRREVQAIELYQFSRELAGAIGLEEIMRVVARCVSRSIGGEVAVLLPQGDPVQLRVSGPAMALDENEAALAVSVYEHDRAQGQALATYPTRTMLYLPLRTGNGTVGLLGVRPKDPAALLTSEQRRSMESFASQAALAIERAQLAEQARRAQALEATEKLQTALLNSISHDLRTPLASITGSLSSLQEDGLRLDDATRRALLENASGEAERLNHLVGNLLDMTRIEAGAMKVTEEPCEVQDVVGSALQRMAEHLGGREVTTKVPPSLPLVPMDFVLMVQVLVNLLDNAAKYSAPGRPIDVTAAAVDGCLELAVADRGAGIPSDDLGRVFDKFYRVQRTGGVSGTGLGLAICKGIVEAHGGEIRGANRDGGGTVMTVVLPLAGPSLGAAKREAS